MSNLSFFTQYSAPGKYNGLAIILSNPSRFDIDTGKLLSPESGAGYFFRNTAMAGLLLHNSYITTVAEHKELPEETRVVILLGQHAMDEILKVKHSIIDDSITLDQQRGSPVVDANNIIYICSYLPQDAMDFKAEYEKKYNLANYNRGMSVVGAGDLSSTDNEDEDEGDSKTTKGRTKRQNYRFWLEKDCQKALALLAKRRQLDIVDEQQFIIYPNSTDIITLLTTTKNEDLYFDIETDNNRHITVFSCSFGNGPVYIVPCIRYDYSSAYTDLPAIFIALSIALQNNTCVGHNIFGFDLFVLANDYHIPIGKLNFDTMLSHHRLYPEIEKSLGHVISLYTTLPYHKSEGVFEPRTIEEERALWLYNGKDVATLKLVKAGILALADRLFARKSIDAGNRMIVPYLTTTLHGIKYDKEAVEVLVKENDRRMNALLKLFRFILGFDFLPTSPKQCVEYFHNIMGYPVIARTPTGKPSLTEKQFYKLALKAEGANNPLISLSIYYRGLSKETGTLGFIPWVK